MDHDNQVYHYGCSKRSGSETEFSGRGLEIGDSICAAVIWVFAKSSKSEYRCSVCGLENSLIHLVV